jgi:hypothetical protein
LIERHTTALSLCLTDCDLKKKIQFPLFQDSFAIGEGSDSVEEENRATERDINLIRVAYQKKKE